MISVNRLLWLMAIVWMMGESICNIHHHHKKRSGVEKHSSEKRHLLHSFHRRSKHCHHRIGSFHPHVHKENNASHCLIALSRFAEDEEEFLSPYDNKTFPYIVLNTGEQLKNHCDYPIFANVGREAFHYLHYILEFYHHPEYFAPLNVFCQVNPATPQEYNQTEFFHDLDRICFGDLKKNHMKHGFAYLGKYVRDFEYGLRPNPNMSQIFENFYGLRGVEHPLEYMKFIPGSCFVVSKAQVFSRPYEYYFQLLRRVDDTLVQFHYGLHVPLNEENNPTVGHLFERAWAEVFRSPCQHAQPWCCTLDCALQPMSPSDL